MGLDTSHDCWQGAYSGFKRFREAVGRAAGLPYVDATLGATLDIDWESVTGEQIAGNWGRALPTWRPKGDVYGVPAYDEVLYLLIHSDCDGELRYEYLPALKARLEEIEPRYEELTVDDDYLHGRLRRFINGLRTAIEAGEDVEFY